MTRVSSETGPLRSVVIHTPGAEIESMTPRTAHEVLYNDIIPISVVRDEHRTLKAFLSLVAEVHEVTDLAAAALADEPTRETLIAGLCRSPRAARRADELRALSPAALTATIIGGLRSRNETLSDVLSPAEYDLPPLPNLYFMRDSSFVIGNSVAIGAMAHPVRTAEAMLLRAAFTSPHGVASAGIVYDGCGDEAGGGPAPRGGPGPRGVPTPGGPATPGADHRIEGGDVLVVRADLLVVGVSERTSSAAVDALAASLVAASGAPLTVLAVVLPRERSTIHLDMVFTLVDRDRALVYEPLVAGARPLDVYRMHLAPGKRSRIRKVDALLPALAAEGVELEAIPCGGRDPVVREREQWLSAANAFAFAPGKVLGYDCNVATMEAFDAAGFAVVGVDEFLSGRRRVEEYDRLFVGLPGINLARGGGGPRCMTLPLARESA